jgi:predicted amidohydrolase
MSRIKIAAAQYPVSAPASWDDAAAQLTQWVAEAAGFGAQLLVFPEYAAMSLAALFAPDLRSDLRHQLHALQDLRKNYQQLHEELARRHDVYILAGSFPWEVAAGRYVNRAWFFAPSGASAYQDKRLLTQLERDSWNVVAGDTLKILRTTLGNIAVNLGYDCEFPLLARAQCEAGAELILVPSRSDSLADYHRVRLGAQARALENQCLVVQAPLVGEAPWSAAIAVNVGRAGIFAAPERGLADNGILVEGELNQPGWVYSEVDPAELRSLREQGPILNSMHWPEQSAAVNLPVERVEL